MNRGEPHKCLYLQHALKGACEPPRRTTRIGSAAPSATAGKGVSEPRVGKQRERAQEARQLRRPLQPRRHCVAARDHAHGVAALEIVGGERRGRARWRARGRPWPARRCTLRRRASALSRKMRDAARGLVFVLAHERAAALRASSASGCRAGRRRRGTRAGRGSRRGGRAALALRRRRRARAAAAAWPSGASCGKTITSVVELDEARLAKQREGNFVERRKPRVRCSGRGAETCGDRTCAAGGRRGASGSSTSCRAACRRRDLRPRR